MGRARPLKVLYPFSAGGLAGAAVSVSLIAEYLRGAGIECLVVFPREDDASGLFLQKGVPVEFSGKSKALIERSRNTTGLSRKLRAVPSAAVELGNAFRFLRRHKPSIVHINRNHEMLTWGVVARCFGIPVIWHVQQQEGHRLLDRLRLRLSDYLIFVANANRVRFRGIHRLPPNVTIHNSVDPGRFYPPEDPRPFRARLGLSRDRLTVGFVGNLVERKRPEWAVQAVADLLEEGFEIQMVVAGEDRSAGAYGNRLRQMTFRSRHGCHIHFLGLRDDVPEIMRAMDILLLTSRPEGEAFPLVVIEAMATGVVVLATDVAGVAEAVKGGLNGVLVNPNDYDGFRDCLRSLIASGAAREAMAEAAVRAARKRFSAQVSALRMISLYEKLMKR